MQHLMYIGLILLSALITYLINRWQTKREELQEYTHVPDIYTMSMIRVRSDEEGRKLMESNK